MTTNIAEYDELFAGEFVKAGLFRGQPRTLTITGIELREFDQDDGTRKRQGVLSFRETDRRMRLNRTNGESIKAMFGTTLANWMGKRVTMRPEKDRFGREVVDAIRVCGSPDIPEDVIFELRLPRRKPKTVRLTVTRKNDTAPSSNVDVEPYTQAE